LKPQVPWLRVFVEGVVIVGSILLAFGIEAWWDGVQEEEKVRQDLLGVAQEIAENRERVLWQVDLMERIAVGGAAMAEMMESDRESTMTDLPDTLAWLVMSTGPTLDASSGALDALITSGRLASVDDLELRRRLSGLGDRIGDALENQFRVVELFDREMRPATYDYFDNTSVNDVGAAFWIQEERVPGRALVHRAHVEFPNSLSIRNLVRFRNLNMGSAVNEMRTVLQELDDLLELLPQDGPDG
jgi:hypothetical protein